MPINTINPESGDYLTNPEVPEELIRETATFLQNRLVELGVQAEAREALIDSNELLGYQQTAEELALRYGGRAPTQQLANQVLQRYNKETYMLEQQARNPRYATALTTIRSAEDNLAVRFKQENPNNKATPTSMKRTMLQQTLGWRQ